MLEIMTNNIRIKEGFKMQLYFENDKILVEEKFTGISINQSVTGLYGIGLNFSEESIVFDKISKEKLIDIREEIDRALSEK
jgi:hypothetical protein